LDCSFWIANFGLLTSASPTCWHHEIVVKPRNTLFATAQNKKPTIYTPLPLLAHSATTRLKNSWKHVQNYNAQFGVISKKVGWISWDFKHTPRSGSISSKDYKENLKPKHSPRSSRRGSGNSSPDDPSPLSFPHLPPSPVSGSSLCRLPPTRTQQQWSRPHSRDRFKFFQNKEYQEEQVHHFQLVEVMDSAPYRRCYVST
jgi:hypothetical protein